MQRDLGEFSLRALIASSITLFLIAVFLVVWYGVNVLLLIFAGILLAILLRGVSHWIAGKTRLSTRWALGVLLLWCLVVLIVGGWLLGASIADQFGELSKRLPEAAANAKARLQEQPWGQELLKRMPDPNRAFSGGATVSRVTGYATGALGALGSVVVVLFIGIFVAFEPRVYIDGLVRLVPPRGRPRAHEVMEALGVTLRGWLTGKAFAMGIVGVLAGLGLWMLGVPLALPLGIITALLSFIPNLGPILALAPAMLIALPEGPMKSVYVFILFTVIQTIEGYVLTPMVQRNLISMPPALIISMQLLFGVLLGALGVLLATPVTAVAIVLVKLLYVEDILGDPVQEPQDKQ